VYGMGFCIIGITIIFIGEIFYMLNKDSKYNLEVLYDVVCILAIAIFKCFSILWVEEFTQSFDNSKNRMHLIISISEAVLAALLLGVNYIYVGQNAKLVFNISQASRDLSDQIIIFGLSLSFIFDEHGLLTVGIIICAIISYFCYYWIIRTSLSPYTAILSDSFKAFIFCIFYVIEFRKNDEGTLLQFLAFSMFGYLFILFGALIMNKILYKRTESSSIASPLRN
jgi:Na+/H+-translocating membrane pyrophosphatase